MTRISFHFNVPDRLLYACRLLRKATRQGARVTATGPAPLLAELDRALWTFDPIEFVPHLRLAPGETPPARLRATPVCLVGDPGAGLHHDVLVNLGVEPPAGFESFERLVEIVSTDEADRLAARVRWKHYSARGYEIERHEVEA
ncbi:MAG: DNA polymerase III subunit chi [Piscinibacter sp.]|nr:DNA polymerase III subunit chi [Piscinibacter sp.]